MYFPCFYTRRGDGFKHRRNGLGLEKKTAAISLSLKVSDPLGGQAIYNNYCYFCHGYQGDAKTVAGIYLSPSPRDFTAKHLSHERMLEAVNNGRKNTAMMAFKARLSAQEINAVVTYIQTAFMHGKEKNTAYHIPANGWDNHEKYRNAFPFALSELSIELDVDALSEAQKEGRKMYLTSCITCHEQKESKALFFETRPVSAPRSGYSHRQNKRNDAVTGATPYAQHDTPPLMSHLNPLEKAGEALFQQNCAFCHAADGTGKNWIGQFMEPHARNLTTPSLRRRMTPKTLRHTIENGLPNTTMSAWKHVLNAQQIDALVAYIQNAFFINPIDMDKPRITTPKP